LLGGLHDLPSDVAVGVGGSDGLDLTWSTFATCAAS
jgi:hypothetical protein